jgi:uncharacterized membrane protein
MRQGRPDSLIDDDVLDPTPHAEASRRATSRAVRSEPDDSFLSDEALDPAPPHRDAISDPPGVDRLARGMAVALVGMGVLHFVAPGPFEKIVPRALGHAKGLVYWSGVAEILSGVLIAVPRTRRTGALLAAATFVTVWPGNWQMALDAGFPPKGAMAWGAWLRLPLQLPMIDAALRLARRSGR